MSEFSLTEQLMMTKDLSDQQKMLFPVEPSQYLLVAKATDQLGG